MPLFQTITDLDQQADVIRQRRYGVIEIEDHHFQAIHFRPWPKIISMAEIWWLGGRFHQNNQGDRCLLYYNQPRGNDDFLALKYIVSSRDATFATFRRALLILDCIALIKASKAIVAEVSNLRISDRLLTRWGWVSHVPQSKRRHFIKRFPKL